ncbi:MAG TPA: DUF4032 domain-containing protein [Acidimicrobiia bacterium]|nr:DUF4032 domain-containing protein [Acidimicrobiia bacterium]
MAPQITIRPGHPDFLDLPWEEPIAQWRFEHLLDLPKGISRHEVRFLSYPSGIYVVKEMPVAAARNDYQILRSLEGLGAPAVIPVGLVESRNTDPTDENAAALITAYEPFSFSYREMLAGAGFGARRNQMLDAFASLLVELHIAGCFWGDCSLSNVLYRFDAETLETIMVDAETAFIIEDGELSTGQREEDVAIMIENVAGGMADIAAEAGQDLDDADLSLGEEIADRYHRLWSELRAVETVRETERFKIREKIDRINRLGFDVEEVDLVPNLDDTAEFRISVKVGGRNFHSNRLKSLTGIDALENQARQILADLHYFTVRTGGESLTGKSATAVRWRVSEFEPTLARIRQVAGIVDPIQGYCDLLHHRYVMATGLGRDVSTGEAFEDWVARGRPGYPLD